MTKVLAILSCMAQLKMLRNKATNCRQKLSAHTFTAVSYGGSAWEIHSIRAQMVSINLNKQLMIKTNVSVTL